MTEQAKPETEFERIERENKKQERRQAEEREKANKDLIKRWRLRRTK